MPAALALVGCHTLPKLGGDTGGCTSLPYGPISGTGELGTKAETAWLAEAEGALLGRRAAGTGDALGLGAPGDWAGYAGAGRTRPHLLSCAPRDPAWCCFCSSPRVATTCR